MDCGMEAWQWIYCIQTMQELGDVENRYASSQSINVLVFVVAVVDLVI